MKQLLYNPCQILIYGINGQSSLNRLDLNFIIGVAPLDTSQYYFFCAHQLIIASNWIWHDHIYQANIHDK